MYLLIFMYRYLDVSDIIRLSRHFPFYTYNPSPKPLRTIASCILSLFLLLVVCHSLYMFIQYQLLSSYANQHSFLSPFPLTQHLDFVFSYVLTDLLQKCISSTKKLLFCSPRRTSVPCAYISS